VRCICIGICGNRGPVACAECGDCGLELFHGSTYHCFADRLVRPSPYP